VNSRTLRLLELDKILARLEDKTACTLGAGRVRALKPVSEVNEARARLAQTSEARRLADSNRTPPFGGISDVTSVVKNASIGSLLDISSLLAIANFAAGARRLRESVIRAPRETFPILHGEATRIVPRGDLEKAVFDAIDADSKEIKDDASLDLLRARRNIRQTQNNIQSRLRQMISDPNVQPHLQEAFVTVRDGRYCIPVRAESRSRVPGIVHDRSGSGGAFFVEPQAVVEMNNHLRELGLEEREAIQTILSELSARVGAAAEDLRPAIAACAELDFAFAKAALSQAMNALEVPIKSAREGADYALLRACHPLVKDCVPNDILLGFGVRGWGFLPKASSKSTPENERTFSAQAETRTPNPEPDSGFDVLLITGPNTGGKTVVLKTLGLLALMTCCGLHVPLAPGSRMAIPGEVWADIGDEQSIEQSLSTFSSHVKTIVQILQNAQRGDLVLLDEVGAGTDPDEGAALAKAVLRTLQRRGVNVVATTHYGELKQFALGAQRFKNASVEFDIQTLRPTYHLRIGIPGASNALDIAARLGMPNDLVNRARRYLGRDRAEAETATQRLEETQRELVAQTQSAQRERDEIEKLKRDYETKIAKLQREAGAQIAASQTDAQNLVREAQAEADKILKDLRSAARESKGTEDARRRLKTLNERVAPPDAAKPAANLFDAPDEDSRAENSAFRIPHSTLAVGDAVMVKTVAKEGVLLSLPDKANRVEVRVGAVRIHVGQSDIEPLKAQGAGGVSQIRIRKSYLVEDEINLIGQNIEDALPALEKYLDDAILAEAKSVRIVHGKGTGALRNAVHRLLKRHRGVGEFALAPPNEGGEGATIVQLG